MEQDKIIDNKITSFNLNERLGTAFKLFSLLAIFLGTFGFGFQKGVIGTTGLGNLSGNYHVKEIFDSAMHGGVFIWHSISFNKAINSWSNLTLSFCIFLLIISFIGFFIFRNETKNKKSICNFSLKSILKNTNQYSIFSVLMSAVSVAIISITHILLSLILKSFLGLLMFFPLMGYATGHYKIMSDLSNDPCLPNSTAKEAKVVRQCTQLYFQGKKLIMGEVILENTEGYIIKRNEAFLYYAKDQSRCFYSKYVLTKEKEFNGFTNVDAELTAFCNELISKP